MGLCSAGHYCPVSSMSMTEELCPMGYYCPQGTEYPERCPNGTFSNDTGLREESQCLPCLQGMYCDGFALLEPTADCIAGTGKAVASFYFNYKSHYRYKATRYSFFKFFYVPRLYTPSCFHHQQS